MRRKKPAGNRSTRQTHPAAVRPRGDKRLRTRQKLIDAAAEIIGTRGLDRTSLEEVAARAGMTRGAVYGNFRNKEELFLAVAATRWKPVAHPPFAPGQSLKEHLRQYGEAVADAAESRRSEAVGATSFVQYVLTHPNLRKLVEQTNAQNYASAAAELATAIPRKELPMTPEAFVRVAHALTEGLVILHALTPALITRQVIIAAFEALG